LVLAVARILPLTDSSSVSELRYAEQPPARGTLELPFVRTRPALAKIAAAVMDVEGADHAIAIEGDIIAEARRRLLVGGYS